MNNKEAFEKWWSINNSITAPSWEKQNAREAWQASQFVSDKEIAELQADNERLRESLETIAFEADLGWIDRAVTEALDIYTYQSLQAHDNEVIASIREVITNNVVPSIEGNWMRLSKLSVLLDELKGKP